MADLYEPDIVTAYYRSSDPIKNLKVKICLKKTTSSNVLLPQNRDDKGNDIGHQRFPRDSDEMELHWQQKVFSQKQYNTVVSTCHHEAYDLWQREVEFYSDDSKCENIIDQKYNKDVKNILTRGKPTNRIFTYVDHDDCRSLTEGMKYRTTSDKEEPTFIAERMANLRRRRVAGRKSVDRSFVPKVNIVDMQPSDDHKNRHHLLPPPAHTMYIMADLSPKDRPATIDDEVILCCIQINSTGIIAIRPDFNKTSNPYVAETYVRGGDLYDYTIEDVSKPMNSQELDREQKMYKELYTRHTEFLQACVGSEFDVPPPDVLKLMVYGEIESAKDFEYDNLYIQFFVDLSKHWSVGGQQQLSWVTQTCQTKVEGNDNVAYFSFPFQLELFYKSYHDDDKDEMPRLPLILIEVLSLDSWSRFRTEGYTYLNIPSSPGNFRNTYQCWRPIGNSVTSELRRFFIGGSPELEDITYTVIPCTFEGSHMSKYAFRTETTGSVTLNLNVIMQSRSFMEHKASKKSLGCLMDALGISTIQANIANVLEAFKNAREKMIKARDSAALDLLKEPIQ